MAADLVMCAKSTCNVDEYNVFEVDPDKPWQTLSHYFPDKVGGKPAWLSLRPLPAPDSLKCGRCGKPCVFLLQKYCPSGDFHRTIFLFVCRDPGCCRRNAGTDNFVVLRSRLPLVNDFYPAAAPDEEYFDMTSDYARPEKFACLCAVCGCVGSKRCGKCRAVTYCSKEHQVAHWKATHRAACGNAAKQEAKDGDCTGILFPELLLDIHDEAEDEEDSDNLEKQCESDQSEACLKLMKSLRQQSQAGSEKLSAAELEEMAAGSAHVDKQFNVFRKKIRHNPSQVLRYGKDGTTLWVTDSNQLADEIEGVPCCEKCGAKRQFEFQVMPQLLNHLNVDATEDSIDWATLVVYTCSADCVAGGEYGVEFLWKQDFVTQQ